MRRFDAQHDGGEVQALVRSGFKSLAHCRYSLLRISDRSKAARWIDGLIGQGLIRSAADIDSGARFSEAVQLAFSHDGLTSALQLPIAAEFPFPTIFARGMAAPERAALLGDEPASRAQWQWHDGDSPGAVHLLAAHYWEKPLDESGLLDPEGLAGFGLERLHTIYTCPFYVREEKEPFGFKDGISQPHVPGLHSKPKRKGDHEAEAGPGDEDATADKDPNALPPGELLLGQLNAYGERSYSPDVDGFGALSHGRRFADNGSYVAIRQIWQDTAALAQFESQHVRTGQSADPTTFERIIGRRRDGTPIRACPAHGGAQGPNDFLFRVEDYEGFHCPRGAHIRRGNPRDALGWDSASGIFASRLHRILRRGRVYREANACQETGTCDSAPAIGCGQGLFFLALNADLERQFEFVQRQWLANFKFADLWQERDALAGGDFSMPGYMPVGKRLTGLPPFTSVIGGGYFFLPSLSALRFIASRGS